MYFITNTCKLLVDNFMKKLILVGMICLVCTGCVSTNTNKRPYKEVREEFIQDSTYFIQTDGALLIDYLEKDTSLTIRDK